MCPTVQAEQEKGKRQGDRLNAVMYLLTGHTVMRDGKKRERGDRTLLSPIAKDTHDDLLPVEAFWMRMQQQKAEEKAKSTHKLMKHSTPC